MLKFVTDPHLGRNALSHTTPASRKHLDAVIEETLFRQLDSVYPIILAGDLFHKAHNSEAVIARGLAAAELCTVVLAGNHDLSNRENTKSSLQLLADVPHLTERIVTTSIGSTMIFRDTIEDVDISFIPHHGSQDLFDDAVISAAAMWGGDIICLHCNVELGFAEGNNAALNLSREQIEALLKVYKYIVVGHEHNHRWMYDNRLLVLGNLFPTSFSDISDKFSWYYDKKKDQWTSEHTWIKDRDYLEVSVEEFIGGWQVQMNTAQFIKITGNIATTGRARDLADAMRDAWDSLPNLIMLRNATTVETVQVNDDISKAGHSDNLIEVIDETVKDTEIESIWAEYKDKYHAK